MLPANISKENLEELIAELVKIGEDKEELSLWIELFDVMTHDSQEKLVENLEKELRDLKKLL